MKHLHRNKAPTGKGAVLIVDDHAAARESMTMSLELSGYAVSSAASAIEALRQLQDEQFDVIVTDLKMPGMDGLEFIRRAEQQDIESQIVMVTAHASVASAVEAMRYGAFDYIEKPFGVEQLEQLVARAMRHGGLVGRRSSVPAPNSDDSAMIGDSRAMRELRRAIAQAAPTDVTVLICGESGTGKELVARAIHSSSRRAGGAMVSLNCPALSPQLMESELFGHERGAFTSADAPRTGRFELADGGTILLDEVSEIDLPLQAKLLRVLQEQSFERVGSSVTLHVDARVVATTNRNLQQHIAEGRFREDLYYRLAVVPLHVPPLRERREDVPMLAGHFLQAASRRIDRDPPALSAAAAELLMSYRWPGNVRELENIMTRVCVMQPAESVSADAVRDCLPPNSVDGHRRDTAKADTVIDASAGMSLQEMEQSLIEATLEQYDGHRERTAQALGIGVRTLANKLRAYGYGPREKSYQTKPLARAA